MTTQRFTRPAPSSHDGGKPAHDADFAAGWAAGQKSYARNAKADACTARRSYGRVSKIHGSWWIDGFCAAVDNARGAYNQPGVCVARTLGLVD